MTARQRLAVCGGLVAFAGALALGLPHQEPVTPASTAQAWQAPVDPADTQARRERRRQEQRDADTQAALDRMQR